MSKEILQVIVGVLLLIGAFAVYALFPGIDTVIPVIMGFFGAIAIFEGADL